MDQGGRSMSYPKLKKFDEMYTPPVAMDYIMPFLDKSKTYWEACYGKGHMANTLKENGFDVVGTKNLDCLTHEPPVDWDIWITKPPFNGNKKFIERAIDLGKPFAFLVRLEHLGGVDACRLFRYLDFRIIIPEKRINYIKPKRLDGKKDSGSPFHSIWLTHKIYLPKQINYIIK